MNIIRAGLLTLLVGLISGCIEASREAPEALANAYGEQVVLYSTSWCGYCTKMRKHLNDHNVSFIEYDIETSEQGKHEFDQLNGNGIPLVLVKGRVVEGYAPKAVIDILKGQPDING